MSMNISIIRPSWPAPQNISACTTLRYPGKCVAPYEGLNLALHVGDNPVVVLENRYDLHNFLNLPQEPRWLNQTHSNIALLAETISADSPPSADASFTQKNNTVCVVMTADCLPILVTNTDGTEVAAIHAGWQGLAKGVIENTLSKLHSKPEELMIWIGPSIQQAHYEVGEDFHAAFAKNHSLEEMHAAFVIQSNQKWLANVPLLAIQRLTRFGVQEKSIYLSNECTYANPEKYFSYRRDGVTGRIASLIFISD
jgi:YfiH family protein